MTEPTTAEERASWLTWSPDFDLCNSDMRRLIADIERLPIAIRLVQKQVDGMREEGCVAIGALESIFVGATSPEEIKRGDPTVQKMAEIASEVLATAEHCDHKAQLDEGSECPAAEEKV